MRDPRARRATMRLPLTVLAVAATIGTSCASDRATEPTAEEYTDAMETMCADTAAELDALPTPDEIGHAEFALGAATIIGAEAERAREIEPTEAAEDDHRAFIANTDEQASRWEDLAEVDRGDAGELDRVSTEIAQLTLGRDELADEMDIAACRRSAT